MLGRHVIACAFSSVLVACGASSAHVAPIARPPAPACGSVPAPPTAAWPISVLAIDSIHSGRSALSPDHRAIAAWSGDDLVLIDVASGFPFRTHAWPQHYIHGVWYSASALYVEFVEHMHHELQRIDLVTGERSLVAGPPPLVLPSGIAARIGGAQRLELDGSDVPCSGDLRVRSLIPAPGGLLLASSDDARRLIDPRDCSVVRTLTNTLPSEDPLAISADGESLVLDGGPQVHLIDASTGAARCSLARDRGVSVPEPMTALAIDRQEVIDGMSGPHTHYFDLRTCAEIPELPGAAAAHAEQWRVAPTPECAIEVRHGDDVVATIDRSNARMDRIYGVRPTPDGHGLLVTGMGRGGLFIDADRVVVSNCSSEYDHFEPDGRWMTQRNASNVCDPHTGEGHVANLTDFGAGSSSEHGLTCGSRPSSPCLWMDRVEGPATVGPDGAHAALDDARGVVRVALAPDGAWLAGAADDDTGVRVWSVASRHVERALPEARPPLAWSADARWLVVDLAGHAAAIDHDGTVRAFTASVAPADVVFDPTVQILGGCSNERLHVLDLTSGEERATDVPCTHVASVDGAFVTEHGALRYVARLDGSFVGSVNEASLQPPDDEPVPLGARTLLRCDGDALESLDTATLALRGRYERGCAELEDVRFSADGTLRVHVDIHREAELVRLTDGAMLRMRLTGPSTVYAWTTDGAFAISGPIGLDGFAVIEEAGRWDAPRVTRADDPGIVEQLHRPTLIADFFSGRELPRAMPRRAEAPASRAPEVSSAPRTHRCSGS